MCGSCAAHLQKASLLFAKLHRLKTVLKGSERCLGRYFHIPERIDQRLSAFCLGVLIGEAHQLGLCSDSAVHGALLQ